MDIPISDVMIHVDESLSSEDMHGLEDRLLTNACVVTACTSQEDPHLLMVTYNPDCTSAHNLLQLVTNTGAHAELVGL